MKPTTEGVVRPPAELAMICGFPFTTTATAEFVVPRSMPTDLPWSLSLSFSEPAAPSSLRNAHGLSPTVTPKNQGFSVIL
jgi:hypothetical protein